MTLRMQINPEYLMQQSPEKVKELRHLQQQMNFPEKHEEPKTNTITGDEGWCYTCLLEWRHKFQLNPMTALYERKPEYRIK